MGVTWCIKWGQGDEEKNGNERAEWKRNKQAFVIENREERERERERWGEAGNGKQSRRNSIKIGEICIAPRNAGKRRDVVERLRGNRNLGAERRGKRR